MEMANVWFVFDFVLVPLMVKETGPMPWLVLDFVLVLLVCQTLERSQYTRLLRIFDVEELHLRLLAQQSPIRWRPASEMPRADCHFGVAC